MYSFDNFKTLQLKACLHLYEDKHVFCYLPWYFWVPFYLRGVLLKRDHFAHLAVALVAVLACALALGWAFVPGSSSEGRGREDPSVELVRDEKASTVDGSRTGEGHRAGQCPSGSKPTSSDGRTHVEDSPTIGDASVADSPTRGVELSGTTSDTDVSGLGNDVPDNAIPVD